MSRANHHTNADRRRGKSRLERELTRHEEEKMTMGMHGETILRTAEALQRAVAEHGKPNSFTCGELAEYGAPSAMQVGRVARWYLDNLARLSGFTLRAHPGRPSRIEVRE